MVVKKAVKLRLFKELHTMIMNECSCTTINETFVSDDSSSKLPDPAQPQPTPDPEKIDRAAPRININPDNVKSRDSIKKPYLNAVVMGHVSSGKSTVSGRFVYECDGIDEDLMTKFEREANQVGFSILRGEILQSR